MSLTPEKEAELKAMTERLGITEDEEFKDKILSTQEIGQRLVQIIGTEDQIDFLDKQIETLGDEAEAKRVEARKVAINHYGRHFQDFDWKIALAGGKVHAKVRLLDISEFLLAVPNGNVTAEVAKFVRDAKDPVREEEKMVLAWVVGAHNTAAKAQPTELTGMSLADRLTFLRSWPRLTIDLLADQCVTLNTWLGLLLEDQLGNS